MHSDLHTADIQQIFVERRSLHGMQNSCKTWSLHLQNLHFSGTVQTNKHPFTEQYAQNAKHMTFLMMSHNKVVHFSMLQNQQIEFFLKMQFLVFLRRRQTWIWALKNGDISERSSEKTQGKCCFKTINFKVNYKNINSHGTGVYTKETNCNEWIQKCLF